MSKFKLGYIGDDWVFQTLMVLLGLAPFALLVVALFCLGIILLIRSQTLEEYRGGGRLLV